MPSVFIKHRVADYAKWKPVFDEHETMRRAAGLTAGVEPMPLPGRG